MIMVYLMCNTRDSVTVFLEARILAKSPFVQRGEKPVKFYINETIIRAPSTR